jgi:small conductance mechanosensitive channel
VKVTAVSVPAMAATAHIVLATLSPGRPAAPLALPEQPTPAPSATDTSPDTSPSCLNASDLCHFIYQHTKVPWIAESSYWLIVKPLRILLIIGLAVIARTIISRTIDRLIRHTTDGVGSGLLRPLRAKIPNGLREATGIPFERRRQRAEALGSVLKSMASAIIFGIVVMMALAELGVNLGPILASAGVAGLAIGFGAQNLVKDFLSGLFMLLEDQYGVGDVIDVGEASGTVEAVGLRITTLRDSHGVLWYFRNGEIARVGNKSQGWAVVTVDVPVGFAVVDRATEVLRTAAATLVDDPQFADDLIAAPEVLGVEQITTDGAVLRTTVKTASEAQWRVARELRNRLIEALDEAGITAALSAGRVFVHQAANAADHPPAGASTAAPAPDSDKQA